MKVALFVDNRSIENVDLSNIMVANPGIGGTQYEMFLLAKLINLRNHDFDFLLILKNEQAGLIDKYLIADCLEKVIDLCNENAVDVLIMRENKQVEMLNKLHNTKVIYWVHNFISFDYARNIAKSNRINRVVFVSKQHYDFYFEYDIRNKSSFIYNTLPFDDKKISINENKKNNVVFTGNIVPIKRLHLLTKIWPSIIKAVPDAKLFVIGTGANAHRDTILGPNQIASKEYEKMILSPLIKSKTLNTVNFLGILGEEKNDIIKSAKLGVSPNKDETFCLSAVEYILNGVPVVAVAKGGLIDVVMDGETGFTFRSLWKIKKTIIKILKGTVSLKISQESLNKMKCKFGFDAFYCSWINTINDVFNDVLPEKLPATKPYIDKGKWIGIACRFCRDKFKLPESFSRLGFYKIIKKA